MNEITKKETMKIEDMIYEIRGVRVMLDSDLAKLYECDTGNLNRARNRNIRRFPETFAFQITKDEYINLKCQSGILNVDLRKINRNLPYVYTEQGVAMLSAVLHSEIAISVSIKIINAFVNMRKYISNNLIEQTYINNLVIKNDERLTLVEETLDKLSEKAKKNLIFFKNDFFDAYLVLKEICESANKEIIIIDDYAGKELLKLLNNINKKIIIISSNLNENDITKYKKQYNNVTFKYSDLFHDRFIIIDKKTLYHCGASFKDLGKKCFGINKIEEQDYIDKLLTEINK